MYAEEFLRELWNANLRETGPQGNGPGSQVRSLANKRIGKTLFAAVEPYLGRCPTDGSEVITTNRLDSSSLRALIREVRACAIHIRGYCTPEIANRLSEQALTEYAHWKLSGHVDTDMFYAGGSIPREVAARSWSEFRRYFAERDEFVKTQREMSEGEWPVDRLRCDLAAAWPAGARISRWLGEEMRPAMMRIMRAEDFPLSKCPRHGLGFIHVDDSFVIRTSHGTCSANIYLRVPETGGRLCVWGVNVGQTKTCSENLRSFILRLVGQHFFDKDWQMHFRAFLPEPFILKPSTGDLIIIHSGRPHSVEPVPCGVRITNQLFITANGDEPLAIGC